MVESWQIGAKAAGVPAMTIAAIFPWCLTPELYAERPDYIESLAAFVRSQPAAIRAGFPPAGGSRPGARCGGTPGANSRADQLTSTRFAVSVAACSERTLVHRHRGMAFPARSEVGRPPEKPPIFFANYFGNTDGARSMNPSPFSARRKSTSALTSSAEM